MGKLEKLKVSNASIPEKHRIKIAKQTLKMPDPILKAMGGMSKEEARKVVRKYRFNK